MNLMEEFADQRERFKACSTCKRELPVSNFNRDSNKANGQIANPAPVRPKLTGIREIKGNKEALVNSDEM